MSTSNVSVGAALAGWYVILCRPLGENRALAGRLRALGAQTLSLPVFRIAAAPDSERACRELRAALGCRVLIFSSPNAVKHAARLCPDWAGSDATAVAVGEATAKALESTAWKAAVVHPERADSEGVLDLPELNGVPRVGLVTAPGGRGLIEARLRARGSDLLRADVYQRVPISLRPKDVARLTSAAGRFALLASSEQAVQRLWQGLPASSLQRLAQGVAVVSSQRLRDTLLQQGFRQIRLARGPSPVQLVCALRDFATASLSCSIKRTALPTQS